MGMILLERGAVTTDEMIHAQRVSVCGRYQRSVNTSARNRDHTAPDEQSAPQKHQGALLRLCIHFLAEVERTAVYV